LALEPAARVLDFGCGFGSVASMLAPKVYEVNVWDSSANVRRRARAKLGGIANIRFLDLAESASMTGFSFDLILVNSVVQYMTPEELSSWLVRWRAMLGETGRIVISDLIPPSNRLMTDVIDIFRFIARRGILLRSLLQSPAELKRYTGKRIQHPLLKLSREDVMREAEAANLSVRFLPRNLTHFKKRLTTVLSKIS
jgi:cyclopropane fatty-acyl-phospholipid synthase-like methyltransferase